VSTDPRYTLFAARAVFDDQLTARDVRVLAALGTYTDRQGWCYPSQSTLAKRLGTGRTHINASLKALERCGYLQTVKQVKESGAQTVNLYRVLMDISAPEAAEAVANAAILPVPHMDTTLSAGGTGRDVAPLVAKQTQDIDPLSAGGTPPCQPAGQPLSSRRDTELYPLELTPGKKRASRLPATWTPRIEEIQFGTVGGLSEAEVMAAADHMRDWAASSPKASKLDWDSTFRNWLRTTISDAKRGRRPVVSASAPDYAVALRIWDKSDQKFWDRDKYGPAPNEPGYRGPTDISSKAQGGNP
jgi:biotin operon repressor